LPYHICGTAKSIFLPKACCRCPSSVTNQPPSRYSICLIGICTAGPGAQEVFSRSFSTPKFWCCTGAWRQAPSPARDTGRPKRPKDQDSLGPAGKIKRIRRPSTLGLRSLLGHAKVYRYIGELMEWPFMALHGQLYSIARLVLTLLLAITCRVPPTPSADRTE
jgi:hypothetical protein